MSDKVAVTSLLESANSSKTGLLAAMKELDLVKQAFIRADELSEKSITLECEMQLIQNSLPQLISAAVFNEKTEEIVRFVQKAIKSSTAKLTQKIYGDLAQKLSVEDLSPLLKQKIDCANFNSLSQQVSTIKTRLDKHVFSDFEDLKTKMKIELTHTANKAEDIQAELLHNEDLLSLKARVASLEQQLSSILAEDYLLEDDEEYDSQEELDSVEDPFERTVYREAKKKESDIDQPVEPENTPKDNAKEPTPELPPEPTDGVAVPVRTTSLEHPKMNRAVSLPRGRSRGSSMVGAAAGTLIVHLNKKLAFLRKDLEILKKDNTEIRASLAFTEKALTDCHRSIDSFNSKTAGLEKMYGELETTFIKALRRKGVEQREELIKKKAETQRSPVKTCHKTELKRVILIESSLDQVTNATNQLKSQQKTKLNEITQSLHYLDEGRKGLAKDLSKLEGSVFSIEKSLLVSISQLRSDIKNLRGPITTVLSDQQRENHILTEDIQRQQGLFRSLIEDYISTLDYQQSLRAGDERSESLDNSYRIFRDCENRSRTRTASHNISLKQRFTFTNKRLRILSPQDATENWVKDVKDLNHLLLPRLLSKQS